MLEYIDFQFRWALAIEPLLREDAAYAEAAGFPIHVTPLHFKSGLFEIVGAETGSFKSRMKATAAAMTVLGGAVASIGGAFTAITGMNPWDFAVHRDGTSVEAPAIPHSAKEQITPICLNPAPFDITVDLKMSNGETVRVVAKVPQGYSPSSDHVYTEMRLKASIEDFPRPGE
ncbi:hypothetical protein ACN6K9_000546 [Streptomyces sp. SAS_267]|uniref:hypothetical protein n=1 Tax=Streptomyces sp. SAS_267 TaxID=3412750 RepID=UPI00403C81A6